MTDLFVAGGCVVITGDMLDATRSAILIATRARKLNGYHIPAGYRDLVAAIEQASRIGHVDVRTEPVLRQLPHEPPTVPITEAATRLGLSKRQIRRRAAQLGGRKIGGRWLLDEHAIREHIEGR